MTKRDTTLRAKQLALAGSVIALAAGQMTVPATAGPREDCAALYRQGVQLTNQHQYAKAADALERAAKLGETALGPTSPELSDIYFTLSHTDFSLGHYAEAAAAMQRTLAIREKAFPPTHQKVANSISDLAFLDDSLGRYDEAEALYKRAATIQEKLSGPDNPNTVRVYNNIAVLYLHAARYAEAEPLLKRVVASWEKALGPANPDVATAYSNLAGLYDLEGRYAEAEPLIKHVLEIREKVQGRDHPDVGVSLKNLARLYSEEGRYADAETLIKRAIQIEEKAFGPDHPEVATSLVILAADYHERHRFDEAEPLLKRALAIREKTLGQTNAETAQVVNNIAGIYVEQKRYTDAEPLLKRASGIYEKTLGSDHPEFASSLHNVGYVYFNEGRLNEAEPFLIRALAIRQKALGPDHPDVALTLHALAAIYDGQGRTAEALASERAATAIIVKRREQDNDTRANNSERERQNSRQYFLRLVHLLWTDSEKAGAPGDSAIDEAFRAAQYAGGIETAKAVSGTMARYASGNDGLAMLVRERQDLSGRWQTLDSDLIKAVALPPEKRNADKEAALRKEHAEVEAKLAADNEKLRTAFPRFAELAEARPVHVADIQAVLGNDEAFTAFTLGDKDSFLFVIRKQDAHLFKLDLTRAQTADTVKALRAALENDTPVDVAKAYQFYQALLGPADALIADAKALIVSPDGALQSLPFSVLVTQPPTGSIAKPSDYQSVAWLIRRQAVTVVPAASSLAALRRYAEEKHGTDPFVGFGDPVFDGSGSKRGIDTASMYQGAEVSPVQLRRLPRLPETADELRAEAKILGAPETSLHLGPNATVTALNHLDLSNTRVLSFATHGLIAGDLPKLGEPALALTPPARATPDDDGLLRASEVSRLKLDADFVILSACNTAAPDGTPGAEGLSGLAKAFFYAGARSLLVSHWPVASEATVRLTTGLIQANASDRGVGRAEALRRAMLAMIDDTSDGAERAHPFYWAPFILAGEGSAGR